MEWEECPKWGVGKCSGRSTNQQGMLKMLNRVSPTAMDCSDCRKCSKWARPIGSGLFQTNATRGHPSCLRILKACAAIEAIDKGKEVHGDISRQGLLEHHIVLGNALMDMYANCGSLRQAQSVPEKLPSCSVVSWNALIAGYAQYGQGQQRPDCFEQMQRNGILPNEVTYVCTSKPVM